MPSGNVSAMAEEFVVNIITGLLFPLIIVGVLLGWPSSSSSSSSSSSEDDEKSSKPTIQSPKISDYDFPEVKRSGGRKGLLVAILAIAAIVVLFFIFR